jgi:hypothetical protein
LATEILISTILEASITGTGLLIAIYALITPISDKIFQKRVELLRKKREQFDKIKSEITPESSDKDIEQLRILAKEIKGIKTFPMYLGPLVLLDLTMFLLTTLSAFVWLISPSGIPEYFPEFFFIISLFGFLTVGILAIADVYDSMKDQFEQLKKEKEKAEKLKIQEDVKIIN